LKDNYNVLNVKPINIPSELFKDKYLKRECNLKNRSEIILNGKEKFIKSVDKIKEFTEVIDNEKYIPEGNYFVSELIDIESEWRAFIFNNKLVGLQNYLGSFTTFPDLKIIDNMILDYKNCPPAYTLDVGINNVAGTFIIEVHNFFSCGLYGFADNKILPQMFIQSFKHEIK
jgi:hypothetical protein